jgi:nucleotide-binding universal stress UspA family protein
MAATIRASQPASQKHSQESLFSGDSIQLHRVIVPIDPTSDAVKGIDSAVGLAKKYGADLFLVHIYKEPYSFAYVRGPRGYAECEQHRSLVKSALLTLRDGVRKQYSQCFAIFRQGVDIRGEISAVAKEITADLIVVPARQPNWLRHLSEGSEAERIFRKSPCPILVVYEGEELQAA